MHALDYTIVHAQSNKEVSEKVEKMLGKGWEPQGGVQVIAGMTTKNIGAGLMPVPTLDFYQAMVLREK